MHQWEVFIELHIGQTIDPRPRYMIPTNQRLSS